MTTDLPAELEELIAQLPQLAEGEEPAAYSSVSAFEDARSAQDEEAFEVGAPGDAPHTAAEAIRLGREWVRIGRDVGVGYCLRTIRSLYGVAPMYPDAETAWEQTDRKHRTAAASEIPWGVPVWWTNGRYGHIALSLGNGRCLTTDYVRTGQLGVAPIAALGPWCGGRLVGWSNDLNEVDVWEPKAEPKPWTVDDRADFLRRALERAIEQDAPKRRIKGLRRWLNGVEARRSTRKK